MKVRELIIGLATQGNFNDDVEILTASGQHVKISGFYVIQGNQCAGEFVIQSESALFLDE